MIYSFNNSIKEGNLMKLYYSPGACSLAPHIALNEAGLQYELEKVDLSNKKTESGEDYLNINHKGYVPALKLNNNELLTEAAVVLQYIASKSDKKLSPDENSFDYYRYKECLNFISTELHKGIGFFFRKNITDEAKNEQIQTLNKRFKILEHTLSMGDTFMVPDAYLFTVLRWAHHFKIDLSGYPAINKYFENVKMRPMVQKALEEEKLK